MERAYIPGKGNFVRVYETSLENPMADKNEIIDCKQTRLQPLTSKLIFDFINVQEVKIDNAEGMTFNDDRSKLIIVTDDNFNTSQETQLITLGVLWN